MIFGRNELDEILQVLSATADGIVAVDREQKIVFWNKAAETLLGFTADEALRRSCYTVIGGRTEEDCLVCDGQCRTVTMALRQELVPTSDMLVCTKAGYEVWLSVSTIVISSRWQNFAVLVHTFRDISGQKELERLLRQLFAHAAKLSVPPGTAPATSPSLSPPSNGLTRREQEVLGLLASGTSTTAIAKRLFISLSTVRHHIHNILAKLGVRSRLEAVAVASKRWLL